MEEVQPEVSEEVVVAEEQAQPVQEQEAGISQEQLNKIVQARAARAAEKARAEEQAKHAAELEQLRSQSQAIGGQQQVDPDYIAKQVDLVMQQKQQQLEEERRMQEVQNIADTYYSKMSKGAELFEDFDSVMADFDPSAFPEIVALVAGMDNAPQMMYELTRNPSKLVTINGLAKQSPKMAQAQLGRLSQSIAANETAQAAEGQAQPPLTHERSSVRAGADNGVKTVGDFKKMSFLKG